MALTLPRAAERDHLRMIRRVLTVVLTAALAAVVVGPAVVALFAVWGRPWVPAGDWAMLELAVADTGTAATRLVGPYSRVGWSHPGPLLFWSLAPLWRSSGGAAWSLLVGAALINVTALMAVVVLAWRRGRLVLLALVALGLVWVVASLDDGMLADPWNPWIGVLALAAVVLGVAGAIEGDGPALVVAVVAGSLCAQSHVGYVPVVGALWLVGGVWAWRRGALGARWWGWGAGLPLAVLWAPVALDLVAGRGNLADLLAGAQGGAPAGMVRGLELVARQLAWGGPWMGGEEPISAVDGAVLGRPLGALVVPLVVFLAALLVGVWRRCGAAVRLQVVVAVAVAAGAVGVTRLDGPAFLYLLRWWWPLAALWWASAAWTLWCAATEGWRPLRPADLPADLPADSRSVAARDQARAAPWVGVWAPVVLGALVVAVALPVAVEAADRVGTHASPEQQLAALVTGATEATLAALGPPGVSEAGVVEVWSGGEGTGWVVDPLSVALVRAGWEVRVPRTPVAEGKWGAGRMSAMDELRWWARSSVSPGDRRSVWVLSGDATPVVGPAAPAPTPVFADDTGADGAPISIWVG